MNKIHIFLKMTVIISQVNQKNNEIARGLIYYILGEIKVCLELFRLVSFKKAKKSNS